MKHLFIIFAILAWLPIAHANAAEPEERINAEAGMTSYLDGDYTAAFSTWEPLFGYFEGEGNIVENQEMLFSLGQMYYNGYGVGKNTAEARKWYSEAAELGHYWAIDQIANIHRYAENHEEAKTWYEKIGRTDQIEYMDVLIKRNE